MFAESQFELAGKFGFAPSVIAILDSLKSPECSCAHYSVRHPADIFHTVSTALLQDFVSLLEEIIGLQRVAQAAGDDLPLSERSVDLYKSLLANFARYTDCAYEVMLAIAPKLILRESDRKQLYKWVNNHVFGAKIYYPIIKTAAEYFREVNNDLKHSSDYLSPITAMVNSQLVAGYFVTAAMADGSLGPSTRFHRGNAGRSTANSFHRDLRRLLYCIYLVADALQRAVTAHFRSRFNRDPDKVASSNYDDGGYREIFNRLSSMQMVYYPDEADKCIPIAHIKMEGNERVVVFVPAFAPKVLTPVRVISRSVIPRGGRIRLPLL